MAIKSGYKKMKNYITGADGDHTQVSYQTMSDTVVVRQANDSTGTTELTLKDKEVTLTWEQYKALVAADKIDPDVLYIVPDKAGGSGASSAEDIDYDNTTSGSTATTVQAAIDDLYSKLASIVDGNNISF